MSDKTICIVSLVGAISCFVLFILAVVESIKMYRNAYSKEAKAEAKGGFIVAAGILALCCVCTLSTINYWAW